MDEELRESQLLNMRQPLSSVATRAIAGKHDIQITNLWFVEGRQHPVSGQLQTSTQGLAAVAELGREACLCERS